MNEQISLWQQELKQRIKETKWINQAPALVAVILVGQITWYHNLCPFLMEEHKMNQIYMLVLEDLHWLSKLRRTTLVVSIKTKTILKIGFVKIVISNSRSLIVFLTITRVELIHSSKYATRISFYKIFRVTI